jgi:hypothetical protein
MFDQDAESYVTFLQNSIMRVTLLAVSDDIYSVYFARDVHTDHMGLADSGILTVGVVNARTRCPQLNICVLPYAQALVH